MVPRKKMLESPTLKNLWIQVSWHLHKSPSAAEVSPLAVGFDIRSIPGPSRSLWGHRCLHNIPSPRLHRDLAICWDTPCGPCWSIQTLPSTCPAECHTRPSSPAYWRNCWGSQTFRHGNPGPRAERREPRRTWQTQADFCLALANPRFFFGKGLILDGRRSPKCWAKELPSHAMAAIPGASHVQFDHVIQAVCHGLGGSTSKCHENKRNRPRVGIGMQNFMVKVGWWCLYMSTWLMIFNKHQIMFNQHHHISLHLSLRLWQWFLNGQGTKIRFSSSSSWCCFSWKFQCCHRAGLCCHYVPSKTNQKVTRIR